MRTHWLWLTSPVVSLVLLGGLGGCSQDKRAARPASAASAAAAETAGPSPKNAPLAENFLQKVRGTCVLKPERVVRLKAQIGGEIKTVLAQQGGKVRQGEVLATIDVENLNLRRERIQIELEKLLQRAQLLAFQVAKAEKELAIVKEISGGPASARFGKEMTALMERRSEARDNELNQALAKLDLKVLDDQLRRSVVRAPMNGVILLRAVEPGMVIGSGVESVGGSEVLFEVADPGKLVAACIIKESDAPLVASGTVATIHVEGLKNQTFPGKIGRVSPVISNEAGLSRRDFFVELDATATGLLPGMNVTVDINGQ